MNAADRAHAIAEKARDVQRRDWWLITKPNCEPIPVLFCPPLLQSEVLTFCSGHYAHCGVTPLIPE